MSNRQERIVYSKANINWISKINCLLSSEVLFEIGKSKEVRTLRYLSLVVPLKKVGDKAVHKELGDGMERAATTASSFKAEQDSDAQTRFEAASKSPMIHLSQEKKPVTVAQASGLEPFQEQSTEEPKELSEEDLKEILEIVLVEETKAEGCK
ncbi:hypothetical protein Tco_1524292 [Tanacetum coccineum]